MKLCLTHPEYGYYSQRDAFGSKGDFITAPEVSQMFGEMIGIFIANAMRSEGKFDIVELGPGRGTLAFDITRTLRKLASLPYSKLSKYYLIESSAKLIEEQQKLLTGIPIVHLPNVESLSEDSIAKVVIANEFFDALPVSLIEFQKTTNSQFTFKELLMTNFPLTELKACESETSLWCKEHENLIAPNLINQESGTFELSLESIKQCSIISSLISESPSNSFALVIDYGNAKSAIVQNSLRAVKQHQFTNPFTAPGEQDITANVNFPLLAAIAQKYHLLAACMSQGEFLLQLGIQMRAQKLNCESAMHRLTSALEMGTLFQAMCLSAGKHPFPFSKDDD
jgi:NADH dehydrogenase [ubiquinone] 1 alpha subcomplex assembly factor 7